jgi:transmembrane sensor
MFPSTSDIEAAASAWIARRDAGMTEAENAEFMRWAADPRHAAVLARHEQTWKIFDRPVNAGQGRALADEFRARFARQRRRRRATTTLAAVWCLFMVGFAWRWTVLEQTEPTHPASGGNAVVVLPETRTLPDGTVVELKSGAEIEIDYSGKFRRVYLRKGEAHYQVRENAARPFIVDVAGVKVRALGTAFSVELGPQAVAVLVTEGQVAVGSDVSHQKSAVSAGNNEDPTDRMRSPTSDLRPLSSDLRVNAGHRLVVELTAEVAPHPVVVPVTAPEVAERLAWRAPRLEFTGAPLAEAIALMNRYNRVQFVIDDPALRSLEVSGYFRADNHETFLRLIEQGFGLESERDGERILLRKAR